MRGELAFVHEVLERNVSVLLESDIIQETLLNHLVHFSLQLQKFLSEINGILQECIISNDLLSSTLNVGSHLLDDELEGALDSLEESEHECEFIELLVLEHLIATGIFVNEVLCLLLNDFCLDGSEQLGLGFHLQEVCGSLLFLKKVLLSLSEVLWAVEAHHPSE